jgi:hypothetical protein
MMLALTPAPDDDEEEEEEEEDWYKGARSVEPTYLIMVEL